jgi:hypothetical protein
MPLLFSRLPETIQDLDIQPVKLEVWIEYGQLLWPVVTFGVRLNVAVVDRDRNLEGRWARSARATTSAGFRCRCTDSYQS